MQTQCPYCHKTSEISVSGTLIRKAGFFRRKSDSKIIQRYKCLLCKRYFSRATFHPCFGQKKRHFNHRIKIDLLSGVSLRRAARKHHLNPKTVARKLVFLGAQAQLQLKAINLSHSPANTIEFDDMESFEHTKCKPLSITLAVEHKSRRILGFKVSRMPAKGKLAKISRKKYGYRKDERTPARRELFSEIKLLTTPNAVIKSDQNPHYPEDVKRFFPQATHEAFKGQRGSIVGQGELKKIRFDPLFSVNHTCAMLRANINRLFRKTWCTTKKPERLTDHIAMYAVYHNFTLIDGS